MASSAGSHLFGSVVALTSKQVWCIEFLAHFYRRSSLQHRSPQLTVQVQRRTPDYFL